MSLIKRKATSLLKVVLFAVLFVNVGCSDKSEVENVAEKFLTHLNNFEFKEAKEYCDDKTASMLGMLEGFGSMAGSMAKKEDKGTFKIISSEIKDDTATVKYSQIKKGESKEEILNLKKIDGKWKVSMNKEDAKKEGKAPAVNGTEDVESPKELGDTINKVDMKLDSIK